MKCATHAQSEGTKQCTKCQRTWCGLCVKQLTVGERVLEVCSRCNAPLGAVTTRFRPAPSVPSLLRRALSIEGLITAVAIAGLDAAIGWAPGFGSVVHLACNAAIVAYYFQIIAHIGEGKDGLPGPSDDTDWGAMRRQTMRGWICIAIAALPLFLWNHFFQDPETPTSAATTLGLVTLGLTYLPAAIVCVVLTSSTLGALYPVAWVQVIARAPGSYVRLWGLFMASLGTLWLLRTVGGLTIGWVPIVGTAAVGSAVNLALFAQAALVGGFLMRHAEDFGYS